MKYHKTRREMLLHAGVGLLGRAAFVSGFDRLSTVNALAATADYKALVCIFMYGGNDSNNTIIPVDTTGFANYTSKRGDLAFSQAQLASTMIAPITAGGSYALHPAMTGLQSLFNQKKVAAVCNVGTLIRPLTKMQYGASGTTRPYQLFSHSDQQNQWQTSNATSDVPFGWGGRIADLYSNSTSTFPEITSVAGVSIFSTGQQSRPVAIAAAPTALNQSLALKKADTVISQILGYDTMATSPNLVNAAGQVTQGALADSASLNTNPAIATVFPNTGLGNQLLQVAKMIKLAPTLGLKRQIFFCSIGGFDTHTNEMPTQQSILGQLSGAMSAFYTATSVELGVGAQVTTFTLSDFSRTFTPAGSGVATVGSDHAWGGHHFVMGDAVAGGDFYGTFPDLVVGGNQDTDTGTGARGRWIPTTAVDEYAATLAQWYGLPSTDLTLVFPNIGNFATNNLQFMM